MTTQEEKRHFARIALDAQARLRCGEDAWTARLLDISLKGALFTRPEAWPGEAGVHCELVVELPESEVTIHMSGTVAHAGMEAVGFRCDQIDLASISHLRRLVELNLGDDRQLERELSELISGGPR